ncbi:MAG: isoprenylcysteine carboxylmethyltransferase family protein [Thermoanaerobaculia bacterium]
MRQLVVVLKSLFMAGCAVVIFGVITWQVRRLDPLILVTLPPWTAVGGVVLMVAGAVLAFACFGLFAASGALSPGTHFPDPEVFISWGPYKYVRNPMTKGAWTVLCGWGFYKHSPSILLFAVLMAAFMHLFIVFVEEPRVERRFGESYREYKRRVNRWVPSWRSLVGGAA